MCKSASLKLSSWHRWIGDNLRCSYAIWGPAINLLFIVCLQMFGCGAVAQLVLSGGTHGMFLTVNFAFGFAATLGILVCGQVSGKEVISLKCFSCSFCFA